MPPLDQVRDAVLLGVLPAALVAAVVMALVERLGGPRFAPAGAALGLASGFMLGGWLQDALTLIANPSAWNRLPWAALLAVQVGLVARLPRVPLVLGWLLRGAVVIAAAWGVVPERVTNALPWLPVAFAAVLMGGWALLEPLADRPPGGSVPMLLALSAFAAGGILIHASSKRLMDAETALGAALTGVAAVSCWRRADGGGAVPGAVVLLPGLLLMGQQETFTEIPWPVFAAPALAPFMLVVALVPPFRSWEGRRLHVLRLALVLVPLAVAVGLAMSIAPLGLGEDAWD
jgi:hypothetical protein